MIRGTNKKTIFGTAVSFAATEARLNLLFNKSSLKECDAGQDYWAEDDNIDRLHQRSDNGSYEV